jgi:hypothetical protein
VSQPPGDDDDDDDGSVLGEPLGVELGAALGEELGPALGEALGAELGPARQLHPDYSHRSFVPHLSACCLRLLSMHPYVQSLGRCWDPRQCAILQSLH